MTATVVEKAEREDAHVVSYQDPAFDDESPFDAPYDSPIVAPYRAAQREAAKADVAAHPALVALKKAAPQFEGATKDARARLAALDADYAAAKKYDPDPVTERAVKALLTPNAEKAKAEIREAVATWRDTFDEQLATAEKEAEAGVAALGRTSPDAEDRAFGFMAALASLTPGRAVDAVLGLAKEIVEGRARPDRATALIPALASAIEMRAGFDTDEMRAAVRTLRIASRDRAFYAARGRLTAVRGARVKLAMYAEQMLDELFANHAPRGGASVAASPLYAGLRP